MDRLVYTSLSALRGAMSRQAATANNLANTNTVGFRAELAAARPLWLRGDTYGARALSSEEIAGADMRAGTTNVTGRELDLALEGDALLSVQAPNGEEGYTRRGDLSTSETGLLTNGDGHPVLGENGPVTIPPYDNLKIEPDGTIWIVPAGGEPTEHKMIDRLKLTSAVGSDVVKGLDGLFRVRGGGALPADPEGRLVSGSLEASNVEATKALTEMIEASRAWDTHIKMISTAREMDGAGADLMRLPD